MKLITPRALFKALMCLLTFVVLQSCKKTSGTWINDKIEARQRQEFHALNQALLSALKTNNSRQLESIMSREFMEATGNARLIELCSIRMRKSKLVMLDQYYMVHPNPDPISVKTFKYDINSYTLTYTPLTREKYIALFTLQNGGDKWLLSAVYNKYKYGWKIDELELNPYALWGKTAPELYQLAKEQYEKNYLVNAFNTMDLSRKLTVPSSLWRYDEQEEMDDFYSKVINEVEDRYKFPVVIKEVPTKPVIIRLFNQDRGDGNYPMIYYVSKISLKDTTAVKNEHQAIKRVIGQLIPGIDKENKYLYYTVFDKMPDWKQKKIDHLEITDSY